MLKMKSSLATIIGAVLFITVSQARPNTEESSSPSSSSSSSQSPLLLSPALTVTTVSPPSSSTSSFAEQILIAAGGEHALNKNASDPGDGPIRKCSHVDDDALNKCLRQILEDLKPKFPTGIPELNIPPMDPLKISNVAFQHGSGPVKVIATFSNVDVRGLSSYNKSDFHVNTKRRVLDFDLGIQQMQITGNYQLAGNLFFFPIGGSGSFWLNLGGITAKGEGRLGAATVNGHKSIVVKKIEIDLDISAIKLHLTNLFNGDALLGNVINNFLNENAKDIFDEVRPQIGNQVASMVTLLANRALSHLSADHFTDTDHLPEPDTAKEQ